MAHALLIIDMQQCMSWPEAGKRNNPAAENNIAKLVDYWRLHQLPVVHIRHLSRSPTSLFRPGQAGADFQERLLPIKGEAIFEKHMPDAFAHSSLEAWLRDRQLTQLIIVGVSTNISVESTARSAGNLEFATSVVSDATFTFDKRDHAGVLRSADEVHAMSLANLDEEFAKVLTTEQVLETVKL